MFRFAVAGAFSVFVYYALLYTCTELVGLWYVTSASVAFLGYYLTSFSLQKFWVFQNRNMGYVRRQLIQFTIMAIGNWIINTSLLYLLVEYTHMWYMYAQAILTVIVSIIAYFAMRWIFREQ